VILRSSSHCFIKEKDLFISDSLAPKEMPSLLALAPISEFGNAEKESLDLVPGEMAVRLFWR
jgi:hypothetical protein